jgi:hypothetical protein
MSQQVFLTTHHPRPDTPRRHRRIIGVVGEFVVYCSGGDRNRSCRKESFEKWVKRTKAVKVGANLKPLPASQQKILA